VWSELSTQAGEACSGALVLAYFTIHPADSSPMLILLSEETERPAPYSFRALVIGGTDRRAFNLHWGGGNGINQAWTSY